MSAENGHATYQDPDPGVLNGPPSRPPNRLVVAEFNVAIAEGPNGGKVLAIHDFNENVIRLHDLNDQQACAHLAEQLTGTTPKVHTPDGAGRVHVPGR